jgi:transcriptional regulator with XRE-family HTH domain
MAEPRPNRALIAAREAKGYSQRKLAVRTREEGHRLRLPTPELEAVCKQIYRLERGLTTRPGEDFYLPALCAALGRSGTELFGEAAPVPPAARDRGWRVTSRKYVPIYVGANVIENVNDSRLIARTCEWITARARQLPYPDATCTVTLFDFGVLVAEITEEVRFSSIAELAIWRKASYRTTRQNVSALVAGEWPSLVGRSPAYVLSTYHLLDQHWAGEDLHTAMRLLCAPSVLLERHSGDPCAEILAKAEIAERACFRDGFNRSDITTFGVDGVAVGYASWSGVSYLALAPARAVSAEEMASFQTIVQALWCYTNMIAEVVETGDDPVVPDAYGWRFLRACLSRLTTARPRETGQHRMMKDAILDTSRLTTQLVDAHAILRDLAPLVGRR